MSIMQKFKIELLTLIKEEGCGFEEIKIKEDKPTDEDGGWRFEEHDNPNLVAIIYCDFCEQNHPLLDYYDLANGTKSFNELLDKYNLEFEWFECAVAYVFKK